MIMESFQLQLEFNDNSYVRYLNISKALNKVWHATLLSKLRTYGVPLKLCHWIQNLSNYQIYIGGNGFSSVPFIVNKVVRYKDLYLPRLLFFSHIDLLFSNFDPIFCLHFLEWSLVQSIQNTIWHTIPTKTTLIRILSMEPSYRTATRLRLLVSS